MGLHAFGAEVAFAAEDLIAIDGEFVKEAGWFGLSGGDEFGEQGAGRVHVSSVDFEIRMDGDDVGWVVHGNRV